MPSKTELERLAHMAHALRPDWPFRSVLTYLEGDHPHRAYRDLAVAIAHIATDPTTQTPRRLGEAGPWWHSTADAPTSLHAARCDRPGHSSYLATNCGACRSEGLATPDDDTTRAWHPAGVPIPPDARAAIDAALHRAPIGGTR